MSSELLRYYRKYGELDQVVRAYLGQRAGDDAEHRSDALEAYLRQMWHTRPWAIANAEQQLRDYAENPPGRLRRKLGEFYPVPDVGLSDAELSDWMRTLADHLRLSIEQGDAPPRVPPQTHWEWHARFPELGQLLGGWFSQDMPDEFEGHDAALADYLGSTSADLVARLCGEVQELAALDLEDGELHVALAELGMEVDVPAPLSPGAWLLLVRDRSAVPPADYGPA